MENKGMLYSIIVPIYNIEKYVKKCIESLISQTYENIEIILVDDGSKDESVKICDEYAKKDKRIKVIHKENGGLSSARNEGLNIATGEYVLFVDGDDFIRENTIEILNQHLFEKKYDVLCFDSYHFKNEKIFGSLMTKIFEDVEDYRKHIILNPSACARVYRLEFLRKNKVRFKEGIIYEDLALIPSLSNYTNNIKIINDCLYYYVMRDNSIMNVKEFKSNRDDKFIALETLEGIFRENGNFDIYKNEIEYLFIKHLLIIYSTEILKYDKNIYGARLKKAMKTVGDKFPNWIDNIYLKKEPIQTKVYLYVFKYRLYGLLKIMNNVFLMLKKRKSE